MIPDEVCDRLLWLLRQGQRGGVAGRRVVGGEVAEGQRGVVGRAAQAFEALGGIKKVTVSRMFYGGTWCEMN